MTANHHCLRRARRSWLRPSLFLAVPGVMVGCDGGRASDASVDDLPVFTAREELRIGSTHDPDLGFTRVGPIAVDADGTTYVAEAGENEIRVFAPNGDRLRTIGREGAGPGEFRSIGPLGLVADTLWVGDSRNRRVTLFDRQGTVLATLRAPEHVLEPEPMWHVRILGTTWLGAGRLRGDRVSVMLRDEMPPGVLVPRLLFDTSGTIVDTLGTRFLSLRTARRPVTVNGRELFLPRIADDTLHVEADRGSFVISRSIASGDGRSTFGVSHLDDDGDTIFTRSYHYRPEPTPPWLIDSMALSFSSGLRRSANPEAARLEQAVRDHAELPAFLPPVASARTSEDGGIWLRRTSAYHPTHRWLLLDSEGTPRGHLELPANVTISWSSGEVFWAAVPDDLDVPWLVRYRIEPR